MSKIKDQFLEKYLDRCQDVPIITVLTEIYENHFIERPQVKNKDNFLELLLPISREEATKLDVEKYEANYVILLCNKLIPKINTLIATNHKEISEKSKSQYPFEIFAWKALDIEFIDSKKELRERAISELTKLYANEGIEINIICTPMYEYEENQLKNNGHFRRISFRFI